MNNRTLTIRLDPFQLLLIFAVQFTTAGLWMGGVVFLCIAALAAYLRLRGESQIGEGRE